MGLGSSGSHFGSRKIEIWYFYFFSASFCFKLITLQFCCATKGSQPKRPAEQIVDSSFLFWNICLRKNLGLSWPLKLNFLPDIFPLFFLPLHFFYFFLEVTLVHGVSYDCALLQDPCLLLPTNHPTTTYRCQVFWSFFMNVSVEYEHISFQRYLEFYYW